MIEIPEEGLRIWVCSRIGKLSFDDKPLDISPKDWCQMDENKAHCSVCDAKPYKIVPVKEEKLSPIHPLRIIQETKP